MPMEENPELQITVRVIGVIGTPFVEPAGTPIQSVYGENIAGRVLLLEPYAAALDDIEGFDRLWLIYWMDGVNEFKPRIIPYRDDREHGVFATRSPSRPNPISVSVVQLLRKQGNIPHIADLDWLTAPGCLTLSPMSPHSIPIPAAERVGSTLPINVAPCQISQPANREVKDVSP